MSGSAWVQLSLHPEEEPWDDAEASEGSSSSSREREGTTWGGEVSAGSATGGAAGGPGWAT